MLELFKTYILEPWHVISAAPAPFVMSVLAAAAILFVIFNFTYGRMLAIKDEAIKSKDAEIRLLDRYKSMADGASPEQLKRKIDTLEQKAALGPPVKTGSIDLYIGADAWSASFVPVIHALTEFWALNSPTRIHGLYARLDTPEHIAVEFRLWSTKDFLASIDPPAVRTQILQVPLDGKKAWSYFHVADDGLKQFAFSPGDYKLALLAYDDDGKEFIVKSDIRFTLTAEQVAHMTSKEGVYLSWNGTEKRYTPLLSNHEVPR